MTVAEETRGDSGGIIPCLEAQRNGVCIYCEVAAGGVWGRRRHVIILT